MARSSGGRPLVVSWESDTSGVKEGADEVIRTVEDTSTKVADSGTQAGETYGENLGDGMADGFQSKSDMVADLLTGFFTVEMAMEFGQRIMDGLIEGMKSRQEAAKQALSDILGSSGTGATDQELYQSGLAALGGGDATQGAAVAQRLGLSPQAVAQLSSGQMDVPGYARPVVDTVAATTAAARNLPWGLGDGALRVLGLDTVADASAALALALDRNTAAQQAPGIVPYNQYGQALPGVNGAAPSSSPTWSNPMLGAGGSATVPTRG